MNKREFEQIEAAIILMDWMPITDKSGSHPAVKKEFVIELLSKFVDIDDDLHTAQMQTADFKKLVQDAVDILVGDIKGLREELEILKTRDTGVRIMLVDLLKEIVEIKAYIDERISGISPWKKREQNGA